AVYDGAVLGPGAPLAGPAIVEGSDTTTVVPPGWTYRIDEHGHGRLAVRPEETP
ncbi:MAG: hydantoinase/oxoprolinase family protein, partial [Solirubrobacterales bacterium]|nr:hydantoinase/oxoprolinase family protein [Solirubrobacterales bacterium]